MTTDRVWVDEYVTREGVKRSGYWRSVGYNATDADPPVSEQAAGHEVRGCVEDGDHSVISGVPDSAAEFFTLYEVDPDGLGHAVEDYPTRHAAETAMDRREAKVAAGLEVLRQRRANGDVAPRTGEERCSSCGEFRARWHTCRAETGVVHDPAAAAAAARYVDHHGDVTVTEYVPHSGQTSWSVEGPGGPFLVTPRAAGGVEVWRGDTIAHGRTFTSVSAGIGDAARQTSDLPEGRPGSEAWMRATTTATEDLNDDQTLQVEEVKSRSGRLLAPPVEISHTRSGINAGVFTVTPQDGQNTTTWPYGAGVSKSTAARQAAAATAARQAPLKCPSCGRFTAVDGGHLCLHSAGHQLNQDGMSPETEAEEIPDGLPDGNYASLKGDDRVKAMVADLEESVKAVVESGQLQRWLDAMATNGMHRWSANNRMLAMVQLLQRGKGLAGHHLMGFRQWEKLNRKVTKGAKAVWILAPITRKVIDEDDNGDERERSRVVGFKGIPVFDISDTSGEPLPASPAKPATGEATPGTIDGLRARVDQAGYSYEEVEIPGCNPATGEGTLGFTDPKSKRIVVDARLAPAQKASTIAHELGHVHCGHVDGDYSEYQKHRGRMETEAETCAFLTMKARGAVDGQTHSFSPGYIASWSKGDPKVMHAAINQAVRAHNKIMEGNWPGGSK